MKANNMAPAFFFTVGDGTKVHFRADQNAVYELEEASGGIPIAAWMIGYGADMVEVEEGGQTRKVFRRARMLDLAWALSASWRQSFCPDMTEAEWRSLLPTGRKWDDLVGKLQAALEECFLGSPTQTPLENTASGSAPAPEPTGGDESLSG